MTSDYVLKFANPYKSFALFLSLSLFFLLPSILFGQTDQVNYVTITSANGLSQNTVHNIFQDSRGYLWFATEDGLNKYDGYKFTVYKNNPLDTNSISDNFVWTITEGKDGLLWIGTNNGGLCSFNRESEKFNRYVYNPKNPNSLSSNNVRSIYQDNKGLIWVGTDRAGLNEFIPGKNKFIHYTHSQTDPKSLSDNTVLVIYADRKGEIWIGGNGGLNLLDRKNKNFTHFHYEPDNPFSLSSDVVISIYEDREGNLWVGTLSGLNKLDRKTGKFTRYFNNADKINQNSDVINNIIEDNSGYLWVATGNGIYHFELKEQKFINAGRYFYFDNSGFNMHNILSIYQDNSGLIWAGTAEGGIIKFDREKLKFVHITHKSSDPNSLSYNTIRSLHQDKNGILWIGTLNGGLDLYNTKTGKFTHYKNKPIEQNSLSNNAVTSIFRDQKGTLWVGTWGGGLNEMTGSFNDEISGKAKFIHYYHDQTNPFSLSNNIIQDIYEDKEKRMWIGTELGLDMFDRSKNTFHNFINNPKDPFSLSNDEVQSCIMEDQFGHLWIGTWGGLNKLIITKDASGEKENYKFYRFGNDPEDQFSLSDNRVISIHQDGEGNLWVGTYGGGLNELTVDQLNLPPNHDVRFNRFSVKDGLSSSIIYGILEDKNGNLWLSTDNGLSKFNPNKLTFRNYYESDGLQSNQFFWGAYCKGIDGELYFGGTNGLNVFNPFELKENTHIPPIVITDFQIFNKPVDINTKGSPLKESISSTKEITLSYSQNVFSLEYAALDFTSPSKNDYSYKMEGFDKNWVAAGNRRFVTYTNLDPGEYTFMVKGSNNDGLWNQKGATLKFIILPPFWRTWWFILLTSVFVGGIVLLIIYVRVKHLLDIERFRTKLAADLHDNIGSGLTEISILSEVISHKLDTVDVNVRKSLQKISENSRNLIDSMSDIVWLVNPNRDSLYDLILRLRDTYSELSSYADISFRSENLKSLERISLSMEHRQHLYLIFKEGISNCITHSGCTEISLDAFVKGRRLEMILRDNGIGFKTDGEFGGNGLTNIKRRAASIGGEIIINSVPGEGTTLHFAGNIL